MKKTFCLIILISLLFTIKGYAATDSQSAEANHRPFVVAYLPTWKLPYPTEWDKITHVCLAFGVVQADGSLDMTAVNKNKEIIREAHDNNVKVLLSIGGGGSKNFSPAIQDPANRERLLANLIQVIEELDLDGIDVDYEEWEGGEGGASPSDLVKRNALEQTYKELRSRIGKEKLIIAAVNSDWDDGGSGVYNCFNNTMHQYLDFVSLMIYDETGPWSGTNVGPHSGWDFFIHGIDHWLNNRKLPKEKLVVGVPFYGYIFTSTNDASDARSMSYRGILQNYPDQDAHLKDNIGLLYYDGMITMKKKAEYIKEKGLGGIMFWEISQDTNDAEKSLLNVIHNVFK